MWIEREISPELKKIAASFPVVVVVGPRQVGKTSLIERTFAPLEYVSLDVAANAEMAETRPDDFLRQYPPPLIVDEIQYAPGLFQTDKNLRRPEPAPAWVVYSSFFLSGSQK